MKTAARMFLIFAAFGVGSGVIYAIMTREYAGLFLFFLFAAANVFLAVLMIMAGDPEEAKRVARERGVEEPHHEVHLPPPSIWPFVIAVGAAILCWGTLIQPVMIMIGGLVIVIGAVGWAGGFRAVNRDLAAWGEVWRHRQYTNLDAIAKELEEAEQEGERGP